MRIASIFVILMGMSALSAMGCKSEAEKYCFEKKPVDYKVLTACGEACDHSKSKKACAHRAELGHELCFKKHNIKACDYMCMHGKTGKDLYCKEQKKLEKAGKKL